MKDFLREDKNRFISPATVPDFHTANKQINCFPIF